MIKLLRKFRYDRLLFLAPPLVLLGPILYFTGNIFLGIVSFDKVEKSLQGGDFKQAIKSANRASDSFYRSNNFFRLGQPMYSFLGLTEKTEKIEKLFQLGKISSEALVSASVAADKGGQVFLSVINGQRKNENWLEIDNQLKNSYQKIQEAESLLDTFSGKEIFFGPYLKKAKKELPAIKDLLVQSRQVIALAPSILGEKGRRRYLLLFQNNMEIRPTGGFIGSYGIVTLENGTILDLDIQDVYFADGQMKGHVEPPTKLREFLGQAGWYLRDSNWDPDFPTSAARAEWFLEKETGQVVDGVIALDLFLAQNLLEVFGEISLPDYQENISAENFFERSQFRNEVGFFPGSTGKKDFLGSVVRFLFEEIKTANNKEALLLGKVFYQALQEKNILMYFHDGDLSTNLAQLNWDGSLKSAKCKSTSNCFEDYLLINEANVGINKANYFLERKLNLETKIKSDQIEKVLTISYKNKSTSNIFPGGLYKNYMRIYLPEGAIGQALTIKGIGDEKSLNWEETKEHGRSIFGFLIEVPAADKREVRFSWKLPLGTGESQYLFLWQKQPGTRNDQRLVRFAWDKEWWVVPETSGFLTADGGILYNDNLSEDKIFNLNLKKL